tara:strand:- start:223 stop:2037 length:1815 start_codon:yes stop_codon:yes gene_type:complete
MADLRIGTILPPAGDIKVGETNVSRIYNGNTLVWGGLLSYNANLGTGTSLGTSRPIYDFAISSNNKVLLVGSDIDTWNGNSISKRPIRLNTDGTLDNDYMDNLTSFADENLDIELFSDGSSLICARTAGNSIFLKKTNEDGTPNTSFNNNSSNFPSGGTYTIGITSNIIIVGGTFLPDKLKALNLDGTSATSFNTNLGTGFNGNIVKIKIQSDGKILVGGNFTSFNNNTRNHLVRLESDGTEDVDFYTNLGAGFSSDVREIETQSDGKILVGGKFTAFNNTTRRNIVRLNEDGTEDVAFYTNLVAGNPLTAFNAQVETIRLQSSGKILVGGYFTLLNNNTRNRLVRLNEDGTEDVAFYTNLDGGFNNIVSTLGIFSNDKILVGGYFNIDFNGTDIDSIIRLNSNGTQDQTTPCSGFSFTSKSQLQTAVNDWVSDPVAATTAYGQINTWCTGDITDMSGLFEDKTTFNDDISNWDVYNVTNIGSMFKNAEAFNQDISQWNVSNVTSMNSMFYNATSFDKDINFWDVSSVTTMNAIFYDAHAFNQDIGSWDVSSVTNMDFMFFDSLAFNQDISSWCVTNIGSEPSNFSTSSPLTPANKPVWGTCPS